MARFACLLALVCTAFTQATAEEQWYAFQTTKFQICGVIAPETLEAVLAGEHKGLITVERVCWRRDGKVHIYPEHGDDEGTYGYSSTMHLAPATINSIVPMAAEFNEAAWQAYEAYAQKQAAKADGEPMY